MPAGERRRRAAVLLVVAVAAGGCGGRAADVTGTTAPPRMEVGACIRQSGGPATVPPDADRELQRVMEAQQRFEGVDCGDARAIARVTALGNEKEFLKELAEDGCPPDTDRAIAVKTALQLDERIMCTRNLEPPHPGDAGGGGGKMIVGDCVVVAGGRAPGVANPVAEVPCGEPGWFAVITAMAPAAATCPGDVLSRLPSPQRPGELLCLAPDGPAARGGTILAPGACLRRHPMSADGLFPPERGDCADPRAVRFEAFADDGGRCPDRERPVAVTGYDRGLCLGRP